MMSNNKQQIFNKLHETLKAHCNLLSDIEFELLHEQFVFCFKQENERQYIININKDIATIEKEYERVSIKAPFAAPKCLDKLVQNLIFVLLRNISFYRATFLYRNDSRFFWSGEFDFIQYVKQNISLKESQLAIVHNYQSLNNNGGIEQFLYIKKILNEIYELNKGK